MHMPRTGQPRNDGSTKCIPSQETTKSHGEPAAQASSNVLASASAWAEGSIRTHKLRKPMRARTVVTQAPCHGSFSVVTKNDEGCAQASSCPRSLDIPGDLCQILGAVLAACSHIGRIPASSPLQKVLCMPIVHDALCRHGTLGNKARSSTEAKIAESQALRRVAIVICAGLLTRVNRI